MKAFLDTNVLVSAFATRGLCADLFEVLSLEHEILIGEVVLKELRRVLRERIGVPRQTVREIENLLRSHTIVRRPRKHLDLGIRDADDEWIIASAISGGADVLVTGDADLLAFRDQTPIEVVSPRELWELLRTRGTD